MKKLSRNEKKSVKGGFHASIGGGLSGSCKCLPWDPDGTCSAPPYAAGNCNCTSTGAPAKYDLNDSSCK
jgi:hypothetical protein